MPPLPFKKIPYEKLNSKQKEAYNFQKVSAILADFGFITIPLSNDWNSADFIMQKHGGTEFHAIQLKGRLTFSPEYYGKKLYLCFRDGTDDNASWYIYDHDELLERHPKKSKMLGSKTWKSNKPYHYPSIPKDLKELLKPYLVPLSERTFS